MVTIECGSCAQHIIEHFAKHQVCEGVFFQQFANTGSKLRCRKSSKLPACR